MTNLISHAVRVKKTMETAHLIPVRMVNEFVYCPRLAYIKWIQNEWADSVNTV